MRKIIYAFVLLLTLSSCSFLIDDEIILSLPYSIPVEEMCNESIYYTLVYFDGSGVRAMHIPRHVRKVNLSVRKGYLSLFLLYPAEDFTPLSAYHEPGDESTPVFSYHASSLIEFLIDVSKERPLLVGNLSLSTILSRYEGDEISKRKFLSLLEKGTLTLSSDIKGDLFPIIIESLPFGRWISDRDDIGDIVVSESGAEVKLFLYEGVYVFIHEDMQQLYRIIVSEDGTNLGKLQQFPIWY